MSCVVDYRKVLQSQRDLRFSDQEHEELPLVSIIIPTYKEAENLPLLVPQLTSVLERSGMLAEILVVDDNSPDKTLAVCQELSQSHRVRLFVRTHERGLSSAVVHGLREAVGSILVVMDADLSHPPAKVPELVAAILENQGDFVIGSRYIAGGTTDDAWGPFRWLNSQVATWMSRGLTAAQDPMAGFFALPRQVWENAEQLNPIGYKIGLELIVKCHCKRVYEVPIHFQDRQYGESKLSLKEQFNYIRHLGRLYRFKLGNYFRPLAFAAVGAIGAVVDLLLLTYYLMFFSFPIARALAIWGAMTCNYLGNRAVTFADRRPEKLGWQYLKFCSSCSLGAVISWAVSTLVWQQLPAGGMSTLLAAVCGILSGFLFNYLLSDWLVFRQKEVDLHEFFNFSLEVATEKESQTEHPQFLTSTTVDELALLKQESQQVSVARRFWSAQWAGGLLVLLVALALTSPNWFRQEIDGLDQAHNVLTSLFFYDFFQDIPWSNPAAYVRDYQQQYPALGLVFWPPLFHAVAGATMLFTGPGLTVIHTVLAGFAVLFAVAMYLSISQTNSPWLAAGACLLALSTPVLFALSNTVMLEIPSLALCLLALWMYRRVIIRGQWRGLGEVLVAGGVFAGIAYTKQPAIFVLGGMALDLLCSHRNLLKQKRTWLAVGLAVCLLMPLALFTWTYGSVNLAQSFGNQGNIYVAHHRIADRWSWAGWSYYLRLLPAQISWGVLAAAVCGGLLFWRKPEFRRDQGIWFWCLLVWYLMFSYFDNKQVRFLAYGIPFLCVIATLACDWLLKNQRQWGLVCLLFLACGTVSHLQQLTAHLPRGYHEMQAMLEDCVGPEQRPGNFAFLGEDHHLFTAQLRLIDPQRQRALWRGKDLISDVESNESSSESALKSFNALCESRQIRWLLIDPELEQGHRMLSWIQAHPTSFRQVGQPVVLNNGLKSVPVLTYEFLGESSETPQSAESALIKKQAPQSQAKGRINPSLERLKTAALMSSPSQIGLRN